MMAFNATDTLQALATATAQLRDAGVSSPEVDARMLLAHSLGIEPGRLALVDTLSADQAETFAGLIDRRARRVPLQHLTGKAYFRYVELFVGPGVFVPRPETEVMTGWAVEQLKAMITQKRRPCVVELCAGSGAISKALAVEVPQSTLHAVELSEEAMPWAERNLSGTGVDLRQGDMADAFEDLNAQVDLVIANPPYIPLDAYESVTPEVRDHDPALALFSGMDGLDALRVVVGVAGRLLRSGGVLAAEHAELQAESAPAVVVASGQFERVRDELDLNRRPRFVTAIRR